MDVSGAMLGRFLSLVTLVMGKQPTRFDGATGPLRKLPGKESRHWAPEAAKSHAQKASPCSNACLNVIRGTCTYGYWIIEGLLTGPTGVEPAYVMTTFYTDAQCPTTFLSLTQTTRPP